MLVSDELEQGIYCTKLPGGGLEYGEGPAEGLKREFREECEVEIEITDHFYTTHFFVRSAFDDSQVISIYYQVKSLGPLKLSFKQTPFDFGEQSGALLQSFRWIPLPDLREEDMTFEIDRYVAKKLKADSIKRTH